MSACEEHVVPPFTTAAELKALRSSFEGSMAEAMNHELFPRLSLDKSEEGRYTSASVQMSWMNMKAGFMCGKSMAMDPITASNVMEHAVTIDSTLEKAAHICELGARMAPIPTSANALRFAAELIRKEKTQAQPTSALAGMMN